MSRLYSTVITTGSPLYTGSPLVSYMLSSFLSDLRSFQLYYVDMTERQTVADVDMAHYNDVDIVPSFHNAISQIRWITIRITSASMKRTDLCSNEQNTELDVC